MLQDIKREGELDYWVHRSSREESDKWQVAFKELLEIPDKTGKTLEVGCGPYGGMLEHVDAKSKVALEPMYAEYVESGLWTSEDIDVISECVEEYKGKKASFDTIIAINSLDHGDSDVSVIPKLMSLLKKGGTLYLHVHLRTPEQLNAVHDHQITENDFKIYSVDFKTEYQILDRDPVLDCEYKTLIARITK